MATENKQPNSSMNLQVGQKPPLANHDSSVLDLAFAMDATGSMGSYIESAQQSIRQIVEEIVGGEKSDIRMALVEYRDHPPQDESFVTRTHDFTDSVKEMKQWLDACTADGGGDHPEAVADALHDVLKLNWRPEATKICVLISDAPPHGLIGGYDGFPDGCPAGIDPVVVVNQMAEKNITVYSVGCEPSINECRDFFMALAHITGGQYVPLGNAKLLAKVIIGGAQEEITLQRLMEEVHQEVMTEMEQKGGVDELDEEALAMNVHMKLQARGAKTKALFRNNEQLEAASDFAQEITEGPTMKEWKAKWDAAGKSTEVQEMGKMGMMASPMMMCAPMGAMCKGEAPMMRFKGAEESLDDCTDSASFDCGVTEDAPYPESMPAMGGAYSAVAEPEPVNETYQIVDTELNLEQAKRMVKRSIAMNKANFKK